jgi:hypothetical protein
MLSSLDRPFDLQPASVLQESTPAGHMSDVAESYSSTKWSQEETRFDNYSCIVQIYSLGEIRQDDRNFLHILYRDYEIKDDKEREKVFHSFRRHQCWQM